MIQFHKKNIFLNMTQGFLNYMTQVLDQLANLDQACLMSVLFLQLKIDHIFSILKKYFIFFSDGDVDVCHSIKSSSWSSNNFNQPRVVNLCPHLYSPFDLHTGKIIIIYFKKNDDVNKSCCILKKTRDDCLHFY